MPSLFLVFIPRVIRIELAIKYLLNHPLCIFMNKMNYTDAQDGGNAGEIRFRDYFFLSNKDVYSLLEIEPVTLPLCKH